MREVSHQPGVLVSVGAALGPLLISVAIAARLRGPSDFVDVASLDPTLRVELPYATEENFTKRRLYPVARCFLRREVADALVEAHRSLSPHGLGLKVWDGYRPRSVQYVMWEAAPASGYVGDPKRGSKHNRGAAVDVTLCDLDSGEDLIMPTAYDEFSLKAHSNFEALPKEVLERRKRLQETMRAHGFSTIRNEWWHFDFRGWENFALEDIPIEELARRADVEQRLAIEIHGPPAPENQKESVGPAKPGVGADEKADRGGEGGSGSNPVEPSPVP